jgi:site-specific recombinase XerD
MTPLKKRMIEELQLRNLSATTVFTYVRSVERFAKYYRQSPEMLGAEHVRDYLLHLKNDRKVQTNTILVQVLLGHGDIRTTAKYLRVSIQRLQSIQSPFDTLNVKPLDRSGDDGRQK